jgi:hypothetical protein
MQGVGGLEDMRVEEEEAFVSEAQENNKALVRRFLEARIKGELDAMDEMMDLDFVNHTKLLPEEEPGREGAKRAIAGSSWASRLPVGS